jgi:hypothetical protein
MEKDSDPPRPRRLLGADVAFDWVTFGAHIHGRSGQKSIEQPRLRCLARRCGTTRCLERQRVTSTGFTYCRRPQVLIGQY